MPRPVFFYSRLNQSLVALVQRRLWLQVLAALLAGAVTGLLLGPDLDLVSRNLSAIVGKWLSLPGRLFLALIQMIIIPLVASSIVLGLSGAGGGPALRRVGFRLGAFIVSTTLAGAFIGATLASAVNPGRGILTGVPPVPGLKPDRETLSAPPHSVLQELGLDLPEMITGLIPQNLTRAILDQDMLAIVFFSLFIGLAVVTANNRDLTKPLVSLSEAVLEVCMTVIRFAMRFAPLAVFGLIADTTLTYGARTLIELGLYVGIVVMGLVGLLALYLVLVSVLGGISPWRFLRAAAPVQLLAFSTSSSAAVMPLTMKTAVEKLGVEPPLAGAIIPLASTVNMAGTALYQSAAIVFLANVAGVALGPLDLAFIMLTLTGASIGAPAAPGASVAVLNATAASFGIATTGLPLVIGVDRVLDMVRTSVNVTGDLVACRLLSRSSGLRKLSKAGGAVSPEPTGADDSAQASGDAPASSPKGRLDMPPADPP